VPEGGRRRRSSSGTRASGGRTDLGQVREWAKEQQKERGWNVADRGRIPQHIIDEYDKAHQ
jgi:hypothetical protein